VGPGHPRIGMGQYQRCLGEGTNWMWHSYVYYILGIRLVLAGLLVDPKIPKDWHGFRLRREFRGATYQINIVNPHRLNMGVKSMNVDGTVVKGNLITPHADGKTHIVEITLSN
jgi:cellobiose phosphorylase